jgi:hypothetical protein
MHTVCSAPLTCITYLTCLLSYMSHMSYLSFVLHASHILLVLHVLHASHILLVFCLTCLTCLFLFSVGEGFGSLHRSGHRRFRLLRATSSRRLHLPTGKTGPELSLKGIDWNQKRNRTRNENRKQGQTQKYLIKSLISSYIFNYLFECFFKPDKNWPELLTSKQAPKQADFKTENLQLLVFKSSNVKYKQ